MAEVKCKGFDDLECRNSGHMALVIAHGYISYRVRSALRYLSQPVVGRQTHFATQLSLQVRFRRLVTRASLLLQYALLRYLLIY